ncbi:MAG: hypothetical protein BGO09_06225 [Bacteroidetes bacterium 47-18]|nr:MAG: hypothetical protein BGO09_06225 [Bacteroidetes bacterium 47-18]
MKILYRFSIIIIICAIIKIVAANTITWGVLNTNTNGGGMSGNEFIFIGIPSLFDLLMTFLLVKLLFSFFFFRSFYRSVLKERIYYLKPLIFSLVLNLLVVIDYFPLLIKNRTDGDIFVLGYVYLLLHFVAFVIYLSFFVYKLFKNKHQQYKFN